MVQQIEQSLFSNMLAEPSIENTYFCLNISVNRTILMYYDPDSFSYECTANQNPPSNSLVEFPWSSFFLRGKFLNLEASHDATWRF